MSAIDAGKYAQRKTRQKPAPQFEPELDKPSPRKWVLGVPYPTELEIAEGRALREYLLDPTDDLKYAHAQAWNAVMRQPEGIAIIRCSLCHTTKFGRLRRDPCLICKCKAFYYG